MSAQLAKARLAPTTGILGSRRALSRQYGEQRPLIADADCVAVIGARAFFPFSTESAAKLPEGAKLIHASADAAQIGWSIVPDVGLAGDAGAVLDDLLRQPQRPAVYPRRVAPNGSRGSKICAPSIVPRTHQDRKRHDELAKEAGAVSLVALTDALGAALPAGALIFDEAISSSRALAAPYRVS